MLGGLLAIGFAVALAAEQVLVKEMRHAAAPWLACREERRGLEDRGVDCWWRVTNQGDVFGGTKGLSKAWRRWRNSRRMCGGGVASCVVALVALEAVGCRRRKGEEEDMDGRVRGINLPVVFAAGRKGVFKAAIRACREGDEWIRALLMLADMGRRGFDAGARRIAEGAQVAIV